MCGGPGRARPQDGASGTTCSKRAARSCHALSSSCAGIGPGDTELEVATGYGEPALAAARLVAPTGRVLATDIAADMLDFGRERATGLNNVELLEADAETPSPEDFTQWAQDVAPPIANLLKGQSPEVQEQVWRKVTDAWAPLTTPGGRVRTENQAIWVAATK